MRHNLVMERSPRRRVVGVFFRCSLCTGMAGHTQWRRQTNRPSNPPCSSWSGGCAVRKPLKRAKVRRFRQWPPEMLPASLAAHLLKWLIGHEWFPSGNFCAPPGMELSAAAPQPLEFWQLGWSGRQHMLSYAWPGSLNLYNRCIRSTRLGVRSIEGR